MVFVKNFTGSSKMFPEPYCNCGSWIEHWFVNRYGFGKRYSKIRCRCCGQVLDYNDIVGGHVKPVFVGNDLFIVPLCKECNSSFNTESFLVSENDLIDADCDECVNN